MATSTRFSDTKLFPVESEVTVKHYTFHVEFRKQRMFAYWLAGKRYPLIAPPVFTHRRWNFVCVGHDGSGDYNIYFTSRFNHKNATVVYKNGGIQVTDLNQQRYPSLSASLTPF